MENAIHEIEQLCQKKILMFQELLGIFRNERQSILRADISTLWVFSRDKQAIAEKIAAFRKMILDVAGEAGMIERTDDQEYSLLKIIAGIPVERQMTLINLRSALNELKRKISTLAMENRHILEESLRTIDDLVRIFMKNSVRDERYNRENYLRPSYVNRKVYSIGEV